MGERVGVGLEEKVNQGLFPGGFAPYGYKVEKSRLVLDEKESEVVRFVYKKYIEGYSLNDIAKKLNAKRIKTRRGNFWYRSVIKKTLESEYVKIGRAHV